ncbi:uncharacterized protein EI90DRAFT_1726258 [Cantharellus anzutake]|uniref:uncharacterized protein n=1 Tax=Cantharellus anzutake TaxID=1750568 RepID=UPI0019084ECA|nr:uncharacterized protein EI90DRAFT_1726258 [Cantharellus anzutake]KAF8341353.1 hypothetical protein EI90DRAFT_1726258 [Cantharellus anzutake]
MAIDRFYPQSSSEYAAQAHIKDNIWSDPDITINTMAACAAYSAVLRFVTRRDEYPISPRNKRELRSVLINHCMDVIHSLISQTRARIPPGGYVLARSIAFDSIERMLNTADNAEALLAFHAPSPTNDLNGGMDPYTNGNHQDSHSQAYPPPPPPHGPATTRV